MKKVDVDFKIIKKNKKYCGLILFVVGEGGLMGYGLVGDGLWMGD